MTCCYYTGQCRRKVQQRWFLRRLSFNHHDVTNTAIIGVVVIVTSIIITIIINNLQHHKVILFLIQQQQRYLLVLPDSISILLLMRFNHVNIGTDPSTSSSIFVTAIDIPFNRIQPIQIVSTINNIPVRRIPLHRSVSDGDYTKPYCFTVKEGLVLSSLTNNFLATQVWPASRVASMIIEQNLPNLLLLLLNNKQDNIVISSPIQTICEFGCGPGLPSLTAAHVINKFANNNNNNNLPDAEQVPVKVVATDIDQLALDLVTAAAIEQGYDTIVSTQLFDLTSLLLTTTTTKTTTTTSTSSTCTNTLPIPVADLYLLSDVFETNTIAIGTATVIATILQNVNPNAIIWIFCQSDRCQRDIFVQELSNQLVQQQQQHQLVNLDKEHNLHQQSSRQQASDTMYSKEAHGILVSDKDDNNRHHYHKLKWTVPNEMMSMPIDSSNNRQLQQIWLCDVDETNVQYT